MSADDTTYYIRLQYTTINGSMGRKDIIDNDSGDAGSLCEVHNQIPSKWRRW